MQIDPPKLARRRTVRRLTGAWLVLVAAFLLWEAFVYRGLFARGAAWQYDSIGAFWPTLTYGLLALILALPAIVVAIVWRRRNLARETSLAPADRLALTLKRARRVHRLLRWLAAGLAVAALTSLLLGFARSGGGGTPARVAVAATGAEPAEGATILTGAMRGRGVAYHTERLLLSRRTLRFAVVPTWDGAGRMRVRYVVQLAPEEPDRASATAPAPATRQGILVRNGLPGPIEQMYRQRGYPLARPYYVLYASENSVRRPYIMAAIEIALIALAALLVSLRQRHHVRWLEQQGEETPGA